MSSEGPARDSVAVRGEQVLLISPPVTPPWTNGSAVLARDLASHGRAFRYRVLGTRGQRGLPGPVTVDPVYVPGHPGMLRQLRVLWRLLRRDDCALHHFFFAPHRAASTAIKAALSVSRKPSIHTVPSLPAGEQPKRLMFADQVVCVSDATAILFRSVGIERVRVIRPSVPLPEEPADPASCRRRLAAGGLPVSDWEDAPVFGYVGDLEFSDGARVFARAIRATARELPEARFAFACRPKTAASRARLDELRRDLARTGLADRVRYFGVLSDMPSFLGALTAPVLAVDSLHAKVDTPIVLLEAMALGRAPIVSDLPPLSELAGLGSGAVVVKRSRAGALADAMVQLAGDDKRARKLGRRARYTVATHFGHDAMVEAYESLYQEVLGAR